MGNHSLGMIFEFGIRCDKHMRLCLQFIVLYDSYIQRKLYSLVCMSVFSWILVSGYSNTVCIGDDHQKEHGKKYNVLEFGKEIQLVLLFTLFVVLC